MSDCRVLYVPQGAYGLLAIHSPDYSHIFTDGATSCVIGIAVGTEKETGADVVALAHLGAAEHIKNWIAYIAQHFSGKVEVHFQGANPPEAPASKENAAILEAKFVKDGKRVETAQQGDVTFVIKTYSIGEGDPREDCRDALGYDVNAGSTCRTLPVAVTHELRDPTSLYLLRTWMEDPGHPDISPNGLPYLFNAREALPDDLVDPILMMASQPPLNQYVLVADKDDATILAEMSTTPTHEPAWFPEAMRRGARVVKEFMLKHGIPVPEAS
eukprot:TRINITY_DN8350_c0_g1_i1.p1 TRINITY_DN8350_c0_g1~~TRINITY_DN8350_c0_g1_i1.p1  ORF type:complete len:271 (+),score=54.16 TRINITY_DN8350_c0_g1_i1:371-1183(+)